MVKKGEQITEYVQNYFSLGMPFWSSAISSLGTFRAGGCTHLKNLICTGGLISHRLVLIFNLFIFLLFRGSFAHIYWGERAWHLRMGR